MVDMDHDNTEAINGIADELEIVEEHLHPPTVVTEPSGRHRYGGITFAAIANGNRIRVAGSVTIDYYWYDVPGAPGANQVFITRSGVLKEYKRVHSPSLRGELTSSFGHPPKKYIYGLDNIESAVSCMSLPLGNGTGLSGRKKTNRDRNDSVLYGNKNMPNQDGIPTSCKVSPPTQNSLGEGSSGSLVDPKVYRQKRGGMCLRTTLLLGG
jgi:hypothetical protein